MTTDHVDMNAYYSYTTFPRRNQKISILSSISITVQASAKDYNFFNTFFIMCLHPLTPLTG